LSVRAAALAEHPGAVALRVAEARHTREIPSAEALHAVGIAGTGVADDTWTPRAAFSEDADRRISSRGRPIHADVLATGLN